MSRTYFILTFFCITVCINGMLIGEASTKAPPGGQIDVNISDVNVITNAEYAVNYINYLSGYSCCTYRESLAEIDGGTEQVVDGSIYRLNIHIGTSFCTNNDLNANRTGCAIQPGSKLRECNVTTLYKTWINYFLLLNASCDPRQLPDQIRQPVDVSDLKVKNAAGFAVDEINHLNGYSPFDDRQQLAELNGGTNEVLEGANYILTIHIGPSICPNMPIFNNASIEECPLIPGKEHQECKVNVIYQPWSRFQVYTLVSHSCESKQQLTATATPGPNTAKPIHRRSLIIDPTDPFYIKGAEFAVKEMNLRDDHTGSEYKAAFANITSGSYIPYGYSRRIHLDIRVGDSDCKYSDTTKTTCLLKEGTELHHCSLSMDYHLLIQRFILHDHHCDK